LPGAAAATATTPSMIGYGMAKAAVHHLVRSLAPHNAEHQHQQGQVEQPLSNATVWGLMPAMLDTEANRKAMPDVHKHGNWTNIDQLAQQIVVWSEQAAKDRPFASGKLVRITTKNYHTEYTQE